jgi:dienelactone hydrolase
VLSPHGHWENGRLMERSMKDAQSLVDRGAERTIDAARYPLQARAANLARLGFVVFHYDMVGYADSRPVVHREGFADADALLRLQSNMGLQTWNGLRALDFVAGLPDVDPSRMAMTGESGGGTQTMILSAIDDRIKAAFPSVMVSGAMQGGCVCENAPLLRIGTNNIEIAALVAPRPLGLAAAKDWTVDLFKLGLPEIQRVYALFGASDEVTARFMPFEHGDHLASRELMYAWFSQHLRPSAPRTPIAEPPFTPVPPADLIVFDAAHPRPADAADAGAVRRVITNASDAQLAALAGNPVRYRETLMTAFRAMINVPGPSSVEATDVREQPHATFVLTDARLLAPSSADTVRILSLTPRSWKSGPIVVWTDPGGARASLFKADGATPVAAAQRLLDGGAMIVAPDVYLTGPEAGNRPRVRNEEVFPPFFYGYNRAPLAERARDLLAAVAFASGRRAGDVHLIAHGRAGVWGLVARALAGPAITRASLDLDGFDFADIRDPFDPMILPGARKYGGIDGLLAVCSTGQTEVYGVPAAARRVPPSGVMFRDPPADSVRMAAWLIGS